MSTPTAELQSSLRQLSIGRSSPAAKDIPRPTVQTTSLAKEAAKKHHSKSKIQEQNHVADSWEDDLDSSSDVDQEDPSSAAPSDVLSPSLSVSAEGPLDPPPTPISPQVSNPATASSTSWSATSPPRSGSDSPASSASRTPTPTSVAPPNTTTTGGREGGSTTTRRPEKQTAVAGRLIAGALGIRAPKRTEEQRAYDRSVKEQEIRRRNREKEAAEKAREEEERAKAAVWDA